MTSNMYALTWLQMTLLYMCKHTYQALEYGTVHTFEYIAYSKVSSTNTSCLEPHPGIYRLLILSKALFQTY